MKSQSLIDQLFGVVVLYKQSLENSESLNSINNAVPDGEMLELLVFDNSPYEQAVNLDLYSKIRFVYKHDPGNPGLSYAYNYGASMGIAKNKKWLLILDQDTDFQPNFFREFGRKSECFSSVKLFAPILKLPDGGILSPCKFNFRGKTIKNIQPGLHDLRASSPVNSGMIINLEAFAKVKGYNESIRLDLSDHQFIERLKKFHTKYVVLDVVGTQDFSDMNDSLAQQITRFRFYKEGTCQFETSSKVKKVLLMLYLPVRAMNKALKYKSMDFFKILLK